MLAGESRGKENGEGLAAKPDSQGSPKEVRASLTLRKADRREVSAAEFQQAETFNRPRRQIRAEENRHRDSSPGGCNSPPRSHGTVRFPHTRGQNPSPRIDTQTDNQKYINRL